MTTLITAAKFFPFILIRPQTDILVLETFRFEDEHYYEEDI